ncbi:MAG: tail fiber domain-containing protein [Moorea sp. SIO2I5]|nr:tail fiber domain-containing protein [Moorena sp. SIO2I5]
MDPENKITTVIIWEEEPKTIKSTGEDYTELEKELKVSFVDAKEVDYNKYRTGDYWLIPTRSQQKVVWPADGKKPDGIVYHYCPLAIVNYNDQPTHPNLEWTVLQDCREIFPALTEMARETALNNGSKGRKLSIGVHSYNDARRAGKETDHANDQLDIQGGKQLTLNAGYWKDELEGAFPTDDDQSIIFSINEQEVMRLSKDDKDQLNIIGNKNLIVEGTSHLKGVVSIGTEDPDNKIGLKVKPQLSIQPGTQGQVVGLKLEPILTANNNNDELTGLHICPQFKQQNNPDNFKKYGLIVESGEIAIGKKALEEEDTRRNSNIWTGVALQPEINAKNENDKLVGLYIKPQFDDNSQEDVEHYGLIVNKGKVGIGEQLSVRDKTSIGVDVSSSLSAQNNADELVGLYIKPSFDDNSKNNVKHYGLIVEEGRVAFGPKITVKEKEKEKDEYLVDIGNETYLNENGNPITKARLKVAGDLEVYGQVTYHAEKGAPGNVELGQQNQDKLLIHGKLETKHTSGKLKVISPLEIQLEEGDTQDFLSLFAANDSASVNGRIVWKKGTVTQEGIDEAAEKDDTKKYVEQAQEAAAISYYLQEGEGENSSSGELRFSTGKNGTLADRMVITADGNVGIGPDGPGENQLKVTGTTDLQTLVVHSSLQVTANTTTELNSLKLTGDGSSKPTLLIPDGNICIGAENIPEENLENGQTDKLRVTGGSTLLEGDLQVGNSSSIALKVNQATQEVRIEGGSQTNDKLVVTGNTKLTGKLKVEPSLKGASSAVEVKPTFTTASEIETAVLINPSLNGQSGGRRTINGSTNLQKWAKKFGLHVMTGNVALCSQSGTVAIGSDQPDSNKLKVTGGSTLLEGILTVAPELEGTSNATEITPTLTSNGESQTLTALKINPTFTVDDNHTGVKKLGLVVESGDVKITSGSLAIGSDNPDTNKLKVTGGSTLLEGILTVAPELEGTSNATEITPTLISSDTDQTLTALRINPTFTGTHENVQQLGLVVETGDVKITSGSLAIGSIINDPIPMSPSDKAPLHVYKYDATNNNLLEIARFERVCEDATSTTEAEGGYIGLYLYDKNQNRGSIPSRIQGARISWRFDNEENDEKSGRLGFWTSQESSEGDYELVERMTITKDGNVGIGTTDPQAKLQVSGGAIMPAAGNTEDSGILFPKDPGVGFGDAAWIRYYVRQGEENGENTTFEIGTSNDPKDHIVLKTSGAVGIGKVPNTEGGVKLDVEGKIRTTDGVLTTSDATLKENVKPLKNGLKKILGLRGVSYQWKDEQNATGETQIGLVAQEVEEVFPELVSTDSQGMKSLSYSKLIAPLIEAIKEQNKKISELAKQVKQQQTKITQLQALNKE